MCKVSIITPFKNAGQWVGECIQSVLHQSFEDWEWIMVNDHSEDQTLSHFKSFIDPRIKVITNAGKGIIDALQTALVHTNGSYITRMDADDIMPPDRLTKMVEALEVAAERTVVTGMVEYFGDKPISEGYMNYQNWLNQINEEGTQWRKIYRECVIASPNWMVRKSDLIVAGGFDDLQYPEDYDLTFRWYQHGFRIVSLPDTTLRWREHPTRTSRTSYHYQQRSFFDLKIRKFLKLEHNGERVVLWGDNVKSKLASSILEREQVAYSIQDLSHYTQINDRPNSQLLVAVYPEINQRKQLEKYLKAIGRNEGVDWWYL